MDYLKGKIQDTGEPQSTDGSRITPVTLHLSSLYTVSALFQHSWLHSKVSRGKRVSPLISSRRDSE